MIDIVTGATYTKESLFQELAILRERQGKLVDALKDLLSRPHTDATKAQEALREIEEGEKR